MPSLLHDLFQSTLTGYIDIMPNDEQQPRLHLLKQVLLPADLVELSNESVDIDNAVSEWRLTHKGKQAIIVGQDLIRL